MVQSKNELFDKKLNQQANLFKALAHPARLQILKYLTESKSCVTGDISDILPLGRTTVNQHIKELKEIGLIKGEINGVRTNYCLDNKKIDELKNILQGFITELEPCKNQNC